MSADAEQIARNIIAGKRFRTHSLENYVETTKELKLDPWQKHLCLMLETDYWLANYSLFASKWVTVNFGFGKPYQISPSGLSIDQEVIDKRKDQGIRTAIHAPPQFGKSAIISQCYPAWILGWDPMHRFRLATYNIIHSARFSLVVKHLIMSEAHIKLFPDPAGHLPKARSKIVEWSTNVRLARPDGQSTFTALGLQTGLTGSGYDTLLMDDPYKSAEEAYSEIARDKTWRFWTDTAATRANERSNVYIMFHRYHQDDMGGRAIAQGEFDLIRYAAICDGPYEDDESGRTFEDPIGRKIGEPLSPRFGPLYYLKQQKKEQTWNSQFQGRPSGKTGNLFDVSLIRTVHPDHVPDILHHVRAWDNAATQGGGAYTAGPLMGIDAAENIYIFGMEREQFGTAQRQALQEDTAKKDGLLVQIHIPIDPGSAGKDIAFQFHQDLSQQGYIVVAEAVSGTKESRAYPFAQAMNARRVFFVLNRDGTTPDWFKPFIGELKEFPNSTYKDQVDSASDGYSHLKRLFYRGLVIKHASKANLLHRSLFSSRFGERIPAHWEVAAAVRVAPDSSHPSGYVIACRAAANAYLGEMVFIVAAQRMYVHSPIRVLEALHVDIVKHCSLGVRHPHIIWLNKGAGDVLQVAAQKMEIHLTLFDDAPSAGVQETNYYLQQIPGRSAFYNRIGSTKCHILVEDDQYEEKDVKDELGMKSLRQDARTWSYTERGEVQPFGGITFDCVRMIMYKFALSATELTIEERRLGQLPPNLQPAAISAKLGTQGFVEAVWAQEAAINLIRVQEEEQRRQAYRNGDSTIGAKAVLRRYRTGRG